MPIHCCKLMDEFLKDKRIPILYSPTTREYSLPLSYKKNITAVQNLVYCPWCGIKFKKSLRHEYFDILEQEYRLDDFDSPEQEKLILKEFKTDEWWKRRSF